MAILAAVVALALILTVLWDTFETIVLPRRVRRKIRLTRFVYRVTWTPWRALAWRMRNEVKRESFLSFYGPLALLFLLVCWATGLVFGFGLLDWAMGSSLHAPTGHPGFGTDLYVSGTTFFTLGLGDVTPANAPERLLTVIEAGIGFGFLALVISYLPILYQAFSRREVNVSQLDARAGSPPTAGALLRRHGAGLPADDLMVFLNKWEQWAAELMESHLSYPSLAYFRSQHDNQSWLGALTVILDTCAVILAGLEDVPKHQARMTFAIARHAAVDLSQIITFEPPKKLSVDRLPPADLEQLRVLLREAGMPFCDNEHATEKLIKLREQYEPYVSVLASMLVTPLPAWLPVEDARDDWEISPWE